MSRNGFEEFVSDSSPSLLRTAFLVAGDLDDAEDLVQEALLKVAKRWHRVRQMEQPAAFARRVLINLALDESRGANRRRTWRPLTGAAEDDRADHNAERALDAVESRSELLLALSQLPPRQRAALVLRYLEDLSEAQVAEALDCSIGTVKSTTSRGLMRLQTALQPVAPSTKPDPEGVDL